MLNWKDNLMGIPKHFDKLSACKFGMRVDLSNRTSFDIFKVHGI